MLEDSVLTVGDCPSTVLNVGDRDEGDGDKGDGDKGEAFKFVSEVVFFKGAHGDGGTASAQERDDSPGSA